MKQSSFTGCISNIYHTYILYRFLTVSNIVLREHTQFWLFHLRDCVSVLVIAFHAGLKLVGLRWKKAMSCISIN